MSDKKSNKDLKSKDSKDNKDQSQSNGKISDDKKKDSTDVSHPSVAGRRLSNAPSPGHK